MLQADPVSIALIFAINKDKHRQALRNVPSGGQVDRKRLRLDRDHDVSLDDAIAIGCAMLLERSISSGPLYGARRLSEARHDEVVRLVVISVGS